MYASSVGPIGTWPSPWPEPMPRKKQFMLEQLAEAQRQKVKRRDLPQWLETAAAGYPGE